jgi:hypothetical protein
MNDAYHFTHPFLAAQCVASTTAFGLPLFLPNTVVLERRRQIGNNIGVEL